MPQYSVTQRGGCRVCGHSELTCYAEFADMPFTDDLLAPGQEGQEFLHPIRVFYCPRCHVSQTQHDVDVRNYYRQYQYTVAASEFAREFMRRLAARTWGAYGLSAGDSVIEVGSGDGVQLECFRDLGARVFGFEPSAPLCQESLRRGVPVAQRLFNSEAVSHVPMELLPIRGVVLTYTFDHLPDPTAFLRDVRTVIDPRRGVLIIEVHDLEKIFDRNEYCLLQHEHTIYCTDATLQGALARAGFVMIDKTLLPEHQRRGNSLLVAATPEGSELACRALPRLPLGRFDSAEAHRSFGVAAQANLLRFAETLRSLRRAGRTLAGYGAGGRGVMMLAMAGLDREVVAFVCDRNRAFHNLVMPRSHVPIVGPEHLFQHPVDEVVVFSFGYMREIAAQLGEHVKRGGKLTSLLDLIQ